MKDNPDFMERISRDLEARKAACKLLEVQESASEEELKRAFRSAAVACHPDHVGNTEDANKRFALVKCAYELLANDGPCEKLLEEINSWTNTPENDQYKLGNSWGHFLWWRDKFFEPRPRSGPGRRNSCI